MADEQLRQRQRDAAAGGPDAQAKLLQERLRAGDLTRDRLELAAHLGHEPARRVLDDPPPHVEESRRWFIEIARWGQVAWLRAAIACFELANAEITDETADLVAAGLAALVRFADCPCRRHARAIVTASSFVDDAGTQHTAGLLLSLGRKLFSWEPRLPGVEVLTGPESLTRPFAEALDEAGALARHVVRSDDDTVVLLDSCGPRIILVIRDIRAATKLGLREAKALADQAPAMLISPFDRASDADNALAHAVVRAVVSASVLTWALR